MSAVFRIGWTAAVVTVVLLSGRATSSDADAAAVPVRCELAPPSDIAGLEACLTQSPRDVELWLDLGAAYERAGRVSDARVAYRRAGDIDPRDAGVGRLAASVR